MDAAIMSDWKEQYDSILLEDVIPFWEKHSIDRVNGGYFTCLDLKGTVFDKDKFVWLQARQVYMFSKFAVHYKEKLPAKSKEWTEIATIGAKFLRDKCMDSEGNFYFAVNSVGKPLTHPYSIFSDCFAVIAFCWFFRATGESWAKELSLKTFENVEKKKANPKGKWNKSFPGTRTLHPMSVPMIDVNLCTELGEAFPEMKSQFTERINKNIEQIFKNHLDTNKQLLRENHADNPEDADTFDGRLVNPGHSLEALWFIMSVAEQNKDTQLINKCVAIIESTLTFGWDVANGGIFYFMDIQKKPPQQLEWDQKLWWVHLEALIACVLGYKLTRKESLLTWSTKLHVYIFSRFHDKQNGEFFGYLNRAGEVLLDLKGGKWKGFFHVPRALFILSGIADDIIKANPQ